MPTAFSVEKTSLPIGREITKGKNIMKNSMLRIASVLLVAVMLTTCMISGVFAGYSVSSAEVNVTAEVSVFGITATATAGADEDLVLIPGGSGTLATVVIDQVQDKTLAVPATLDYTGSISMTGFSDDYCPIVFTVFGEEIKMDGDITTVEGLVNAVNAKIAAETASFDPDNFQKYEKTIDWSWTPGAQDNDVTTGSITLTLRATVAQN